MLNLSNIITVVEIMLAELIFLSAFPRRSSFPMRLALSMTAAVAIAALVPEGDLMTENLWEKVYLFFRFFMLFGISVIPMWFSFEAPFSAVLAASSAGYAVQHFGSRLANIALMLVGVNLFGLKFPYSIFAAEALTFPCVYAAAFFIFGLPARKYKFFGRRNMSVSILSIAMVLVCIGISRFDKNYAGLIYPMAMCVFALLVQIGLSRTLALREENEVMRRVVREEARRYEISRENRELLNIKFHDLKYRLAALEGRLPREELDGISRAINIYDRDVNTGSEVMDVILAEKHVRCDGLGISLTCMGDFGALEGMTAGDEYAFFGNAIDNAIEAVSRLENRDKRQISVTVEKRGDPVMVTVANFYDGNILMEDGEIRTTKEGEQGYHGFGIRSMRAIAERYGGGLSVAADGELFSLSAWFIL